jgi:uroporphyrinogen-III synthase
VDWRMYVYYRTYDLEYNQITYAQHIANVMRSGIVVTSAKQARYVFAIYKNKYTRYIEYLKYERRLNMKLNVTQRKLLIQAIKIAIHDNNRDAFTKEELAEFDLLTVEIGKYVK